MFSFIKQKWIEWMVSVIIVIITVLLTNHFAIQRDADMVIQKELKDKASIEYVDQQTTNLKSYIDVQDENTKELIRRHDEETAKATQITIEWLKSINNKIDKVQDKIDKMR